MSLSIYLCVCVCVCAGAEHKSICVQPECNTKEVDADCETQTVTGENRRGSQSEGWMERCRNVAAEGASALTLYVASLR